VVETILRLAGQGKPVCVDARYGVGQYRGVAIAKPNEVELEQAVGRPLGGDPRRWRTPGASCSGPPREGFARHAGRAGMMLLRANGPTAVLPAHGSSNAVDVTGAAIP